MTKTHTYRFSRQFKSTDGTKSVWDIISAVKRRRRSYQRRVEKIRTEICTKYPRNPARAVGELAIVLASMLGEDFKRPREVILQLIISQCPNPRLLQHAVTEARRHGA